MKGCGHLNFVTDKHHKPTTITLVFLYILQIDLNINDITTEDWFSMFMPTSNKIHASMWIRMFYLIIYKLNGFRLDLVLLVWTEKCRAVLVLIHTALIKTILCMKLDSKFEVLSKNGFIRRKGICIPLWQNVEWSSSLSCDRSISSSKLSERDCPGKVLLW
jgi:hypothetical protein